MKRAKMSMVMNEGVNIHCKEVTTQVFPNLLVELVADITKSKGSIYASPSLRQTLVTVTSNCPVIYSSILSSFPAVHFSLTCKM